jgi:hypothetical protein
MRMNEIVSRKQTIKQAEQMLRITEQKVDLVNNKREFESAFCQRSFYGEEINEKPKTTEKKHEKRPSRASIGSF